MSLRKASKTYDIPLRTLSNVMKSKHMGASGHPPVFNKKEELSFVEHIQIAGQLGFPRMMLNFREILGFSDDLRDDVAVRAFTSQSVDLGFNPLVQSYQKTLKNDIHSFPAWRSAFKGGCGEQADKFACSVLGQGT